MAKHRDDGDPSETVHEPATRRRVRVYLVAAGTAVFLLLAGTAWILTEPDLPDSTFTMPTGDNGDQAVEGFGQPSPSPSQSPRPSPRVSPSPSLGPAAGVQSTGPPPAAAHYRLDETSGTTTSDASGHGLTGTLHGGAAFVAGRLGNGVSLSGSSQYLSLPAGILSGTTSFTVSAWVRPDAVTTWSRVFDFGSGTGVNMFFTPRSSSGTARFAITTGGAGSEQRINAPAALASGTWTHVAVTLSGGTGILYLNRVEVARTTGMTLSPASLGSMPNCWIGRSQYSADPYFDGILDDLRVYKRALPPAEIAALP